MLEVWKSHELLFNKRLFLFWNNALLCGCSFLNLLMISSLMYVSILNKVWEKCGTIRYIKKKTKSYFPPFWNAITEVLLKLATNVLEFLITHPSAIWILSQSQDPYLVDFGRAFTVHPRIILYLKQWFQSDKRQLYQ